MNKKLMLLLSFLSFYPLCNSFPWPLPIINYWTQQQKLVKVPSAETTQLKAIIFDLDGVLFKTNELKAFQTIGVKTVAQHFVATGTFPSKKNLFKILENAPAMSTTPAFNDGIKMPQIMVDWQCGLQSIQSIDRIMKAHIDQSNIVIAEKETFYNIIDLMLDIDKLIATRTIIQEGKQLLYDLKQQGYRLYVLSNWDPSSFDHFVESFPEIFQWNGGNMFDGIMTSGEVETLKPHKSIFTKLLKKFEINPQEALFIDDTIENVKAAQDLADIKSVHCDPKNFQTTRNAVIDHIKNS